jgi:hypothetical protein
MAPMDESSVMTAPKRYFLRHLLWAFPTRLVRVWFETEKSPVEVVRLVNEAFVGGLAPRRRLCRDALVAAAASKSWISAGTMNGCSGHHERKPFVFFFEYGLAAFPSGVACLL